MTNFTMFNIQRVCSRHNGNFETGLLYIENQDKTVCYE